MYGNVPIQGSIVLTFHHDSHTLVPRQFMPAERTSELFTNSMIHYL